MEEMNIAITMTEYALNCKLSGDPVDQLVAAENTLLVIEHGVDQQLLFNYKYVQTGMPQLDGHLQEVWTTDSAVQTSREGEVYISQSGDLLFLSCCIKESGDLVADTRRVYEQLLNITREKGCPNLLRAWNYIADINRGEGDSERYKLFCAGRYAAFNQCGISEKNYPAASALGHGSDYLVIYLISAAFQGVHIENPKQHSAYTYPREYGPRSPSFARATVCSELGQSFISGTASITGHQTLHADDIERQLELTLENIETLIAHIEEAQRLQLETGLFKVYIRNPQDVPSIRASIATRYPALATLYLQADICRADLLLEIEAIYHHR